MAKTENRTRADRDLELARIDPKDINEILGDVDYTYVNHVRLASSKWDIRFAFGDLRPNGTVAPKVGVVVSHLHAKQLSEALLRIVRDLEERIGPIEDPDVRGQKSGKPKVTPSRKRKV